MEKSYRGVQMLRWRLRLLMAEKKITNKELAELSGLHPTSISRLKGIDEIEQITGKTLESVCAGLTRAYCARGEMRVITPGDLFEYTFDNDDDLKAIYSEAVASRKNKKSNKSGKRSQAKTANDAKLIQFPGWKAG